MGGSPGGRHGNPLQSSCLENPTDRGAWWAIVHGVTQSQARLGMHTSSEPSLTCLTPSPPCLGSWSQKLLLGDSQSRYHLRCQEIQRKAQAVARSPGERASGPFPRRRQPGVQQRSPCQRCALPRAQPRLSTWPAAQPCPVHGTLAQEAAEFLPAAPNFLEMLSSGPVLREGVRRGSVGPAPNPPPFLYMAAPGSESGEPSIGQGSG